MADLARLRFLSPEQTANLLRWASPIATISTNEARSLLGLPAIPGEEGNIRLQSLNYVDSLKAAKYQLNDAKDEGEGGNE